MTAFYQGKQRQEHGGLPGPPPAPVAWEQSLGFNVPEGRSPGGATPGKSAVARGAVLGEGRLLSTQEEVSGHEDCLL